MRPGKSALTVLRDGEALYSSDDGTLYRSWSAVKSMITVVIYQLAEEGHLDLDAPISWLWPEFAAGGKRQVTTRDVLQHRSGLDLRLAEVATILNPERAVKVTARLRARRGRDAKPHYQVLAYGVVLGEIARRVTGQPLKDLLHERIIEPLGLRGHGYLGLPADQEHRAAGQTGSGPLFGLVGKVASTSRAQAAPIPSGGLWTTSTLLAAFYDALAAGELVSDEALSDILREHFDGNDGTTLVHTRWANGMQLGVGGKFFGTNPSPRLYGHNGSAICIGWHDPDANLSVGIVNSHILRPWAAIADLREVADWIQLEFPPASSK